MQIDSISDFNCDIKFNQQENLLNKFYLIYLIVKIAQYIFSMFNPAGVVTPGVLRYILCSTECSCIGAQNIVKEKEKRWQQSRFFLPPTKDRRKEEDRAERKKVVYTRDTRFKACTYVRMSVCPAVCLSVYALQFHQQSEPYKNTLKYMNMCFTGMFTVECILKIAAFGVKVGFTHRQTSFIHRALNIFRIKRDLIRNSRQVESCERWFFVTVLQNRKSEEIHLLSLIVVSRGISIYCRDNW